MVGDGLCGGFSARGACGVWGLLLGGETGVAPPSSALGANSAPFRKNALSRSSMFGNFQRSEWDNTFAMAHHAF